MSLEERIASWSDLGILNYSDAFELQKDLAKRRADEKIHDTILICQHRPIIHFSANSVLNSFSKYLFDEMKEKGYSDKISERDVIDYLNRTGIEFGRSTRGGGGAYIGPGQIVVYPVVDYEKITGSKFGINQYKNLIDEVMRDVINSYGVDAQILKNSDFIEVSDERSDRKDVWVLKDNRPYKLGGKTIITSRNVAYHGFCFYLDKEGISGFKYVNPCGHTDEELGVECMENLVGRKIDYEDFKQNVLNVLEERFAYTSLSEVDKNRFS